MDQPDRRGDISPSHRQHRLAHLDGIRAIAILAVVGFHWSRGQVPLFAGGYAGVDVFLALSGYLITSILMRPSTESPRAAFARFFAARIRRLYPALVFLVVGVVAITELIRTDRNTMLHPSVASCLVALLQLGWLPVVYHWNTHALLLVHTWSLAVEWTFYLVWPWVLWRSVLGRRHAWRIVAGASVLVWVGSAALLPWDWFYAAPLSRAAQLGAGCAFALYRGDRVGRNVPPRPVLTGVVFVASLAVIGYWTVLGPDASTSYRWGVFALIPLATLGLIHSGFESAWARRILGMRLAVGIGRASYSLYLWHVPMALLLTNEALGTSRAAAGLVLVAATAVLTFASYWLLERPYFRRSGVREAAKVTSPTR